VISATDILEAEGKAFDVSKTLRELSLSEKSDTVSPIFLYSCGWRSGSTFLQRAMIGRGRFMWGEPYATSAPIRNLIEAWHPIVSNTVPASYYIDDSRYANKIPETSQWTANLYPARHTLFFAQRQFLSALFGQRESDGEHTPWGIKFVRLGAGHAACMQAYFPESSCVFLLRNPYDAYLSFITKISSNNNTVGWHYRWPYSPVRSASDFASIWRGLAESVLRYRLASKSTVVKYEDIVKGKVPASMQSLFEGDRIARVGSSHTHTSQHLSAWEINEIKRCVGSVGEHFGYFSPSESV